MTAFLSVEGAAKRFAPVLTFGDKVATWLGAQKPPRTVHAVDGVDLFVERGAVLGLVGESGSGKSTLGRMVAGIHVPTEGSIRLEGMPVMSPGNRPRKITTRVQMVFQDPFASLDPRMRIADTLAEGPIAHGLTTRREAMAYARKWLETVGLDPDYATRFPHQFSGGQRQRVAIARALAMQPDLLVCDEPVASLDVSIQAQIINLLMRLRRELNLTLLFISHDLSVVRHLCDRVAIMYLGRIVEEGPTPEVYETPRHPYTRALLESVPRLEIDDDVDVVFRPIEGELPSPQNPPAGCHFNARCPLVFDRCRIERPLLNEVGNGRLAACHLASPDQAGPNLAIKPISG